MTPEQTKEVLETFLNTDIPTAKMGGQMKGFVKFSFKRVRNELPREFTDTEQNNLKKMITANGHRCFTSKTGIEIEFKDLDA